jgi:aminomethyltransferase
MAHEPKAHEPHPTGPLAQTALHDWHVSHGAKMTPFAGYDMPVWYPTGLTAEHLHCRSAAGMFDVSHMGVAVVRSSSFAAVAAALERVMPADVAGIGPGRQRYSQILNAEGGVVDDVMLSRPATEVTGAAAGIDDLRADESVTLVVNAGTKREVLAYLRAELAVDPDLTITEFPETVLIAVQGPTAAAAVEAMVPGAAALRFMDSRVLVSRGGSIVVSSSGYTGEDGFELAVAEPALGISLWDALAADESVRPIGLGARDTLRMEAALCLCGSDLDPTISPIEAGLEWSIQRRRREDIAARGSDAVLGGDRLRQELLHGPARRRIGLRPKGRAPVRGGAALFRSGAGDGSAYGIQVGVITSGGFSPSLDAPVAMGYVDAASSAQEVALVAELRGRYVELERASLPFVAHRYHR